jgi:hypothetical protein
MTSQINPNNVNGNFPIAGVPNNTQGFRDNFTNIKTNFEFAETEIDELQSKSILKSALSGAALDNNVGNNLVYNARVQGISGTFVQIANTAGFINIDASAGPYQSIVMGGNINLAFTANTWPSAGSYGKVRVEITGTTGQTITLPAAVTQGALGIQGINAGVITLAASGTYEFDFSTTDGGASLTVFDLNRPLNYYTNTVTVAATTPSTSAGTGALIVAGGVGVAGNLYVTGDIVGNLVVTGQTFTGNVSAGNFLASGLVSATSNVIGGNISTAGLVTATGNIIGGNLNAAGLSLSGNVLSAINMTANITTTGGNLQAGNLLTGGIASATGNITGGNLRTTGQISATSNITGGNLNVAGNVVGGNVSTAGLITATGNITSAANIGAGNVNATLFTGTTVSVTGNVTAGNLNAAGLSLTSNVVSALNVTGNVTGGNINTGAQVVATGNVSGGNIVTAALVRGQTVSATANVVGGNVSTAGLITATGNITGGNINTGAQVVATGNITGGNINTGAQVSATGNITGNYFLGNGSQLTGISSLTAISEGTTNMTVNGSGGNISTTIGGTSNVAVFASTGINVLGTVSASGNVTGGNLLTLGLISATGNVTGGNINTGAQVVATGNVTGGNLTTGAQVVATGNVTGGNLRTAGQLLAASATAIAAGGSQSLGLEFSSTADFGIFFGSGAPTISAAQGSLYLRSDGTTTNNRMYVNTDGLTAWTAVTTAS